MNKKKIQIWKFGLVLCVGILIVAILIVNASRTVLETKRYSVRLGVSLQPSNALILIARQQGFFEKEGIDITAQEYPSGKRALVDGLLTKEVDIITTSEVPLVFNSSEHSPFLVIAANGSTDSIQQIVARKSAGVGTPEDLRSKHIATQQGSAVHFFLSRFLLLHSIPQENIALSFHKAEELPGLLVQGDIDAFSMREPYTSQAIELLGNDVIIFEELGTYISSELLVANRLFVEKNPGAVKAILRALKRAEEYVLDQPVEAKRILADTLGSTIEDIEALWPRMNFRLSLDQAHLLTLENVGLWAQSNQLIENDTQVNYLELMYTDALYEIDPLSVSIIR